MTDFEMAASSQIHASGGNCSMVGGMGPISNPDQLGLMERKAGGPAPKREKDHDGDYQLLGRFFQMSLMTRSRSRLIDLMEG